jgi:hypothetical protein
MQVPNRHSPTKKCTCRDMGIPGIGVRKVTDLAYIFAPPNSRALHTTAVSASWRPHASAAYMHWVHGVQRKLDPQAPQRRTAPVRCGSTTTDTNERSKRQHLLCHFVTVYADPAKYELGVFPSSDPDAGGLVGSGKNPIGNRPRRPEIAR